MHVSAPQLAPLNPKLFQSYWEFRNGSPFVELFASTAATSQPFANVDTAVAAARSLSDGDQPALGVFQTSAGFSLLNLSHSAPAQTSVTLDGLFRALNPLNDLVMDSPLPGGLISIVDGKQSAHIATRPALPGNKLHKFAFEGHLALDAPA